MPDKPIIFSGAMVRANIEGRKRQTRRILQPVPQGTQVGPGSTLVHEGVNGSDFHRRVIGHFRPKWAKGDRLWVRETCRAEELPNGADGVRYAADGHFIPIEDSRAGADQWLSLRGYRQKVSKRVRIGLPVPSIHMPRWCSRLTLLVTDVGVERLQDITEADARAEGAKLHVPCKSAVGGTTIAADSWHFDQDDTGRLYEGRTARDAFEILWGKINGWKSWDANPWVAVISYDLVKQNIDRISA